MRPGNRHIPPQLLSTISKKDIKIRIPRNIQLVSGETYDRKWRLESNKLL